MSTRGTTPLKREPATAPNPYAMPTNKISPRPAPKASPPKNVEVRSPCVEEREREKEERRVEGKGWSG